MSDDEDSKKVQPPKVDQKHALTRAAAEGVVGLIPGGSAIATVWKVTHPSKAERNRGEWEQTISDRTNEHSDRLDQYEEQLSHHQKVSGVTAQLVSALANDCPDGLGRKSYKLDDITRLLPDENHQEIEDAAYELESYGLLRFRHYLGGWHLTLSPEFYDQFDHQVMGWNNEEDAIALASLMLRLDTGNAPQLHEEVGWPRRRFNPALRALLPLFPEGRIRRVIQPDYVTMGVALAREDKAALRRLIQKHES